MIEKYIKYITSKGQTELTIDKTRKHLIAFEKYTKKSINATKKDVENYYRYLRSKNMDNETIRTRLSRIRVYFRYLKEEGYILYNPADEVNVADKKKRLPQNVPSHEDMMKLLSKPNTSTMKGLRDRAILELLYSTGIRLRETVNLDIYDVNFEAKEVFIRKGKGRKDRVVPLGREASKWLEIYIERIRTKLAKPDETALFINNSGDRIKWERVYGAVRENRGEKRISPHKIRHACAVGMLRGGADTRVIQELLGHNWLSTTQIYTKLTASDIKTCHKKLHPRG